MTNEGEGSGDGGGGGGGELKRRLFLEKLEKKGGKNANSYFPTTTTTP